MKQRFGHDEHFDIHFSMLYSLYSFPNIVLPLVCGILIDRVGIKVKRTTSSTFILLFAYDENRNTNFIKDCLLGALSEQSGY